MSLFGISGCFLTVCMQDAQDLDFERLIRTVIERHTRAIFREFALRLRNNPVFSLPGTVEVVEEGMLSYVYLHEEG
jgi:mediator of RNA polymerase II transcription subunit 14